MTSTDKKLKKKSLSELLRMTKNTKMYDEDNVPLYVVRRNLYRKAMVTVANMQIRMDKNVSVKHPFENKQKAVRVTSTRIEYNLQDWCEQWLQYRRKTNRKFVMLDGLLVK